ncbi:MAG TPA: chemotaxis protein [Novosphingobium sp.]|nr:chemotaxis protein [Novosphingobium sp.]
MRHETFHLPALDAADSHASGEDLTGQARALMSEIVETLDERFSPTGETLAQLIESITTVSSNMEGLGLVLGCAEGEDSLAVSGLAQAAQQLREAPARQAERGLHVSKLGASIGRLEGLSAEILRLLMMLQFYTVNLKIAAAGQPEFIEFANDMAVKLKASGQEVETFNRQIVMLQANLTEMHKVDELLARECARVIPQLPDQLDREVSGLRGRQMWMAQMSNTVRAIIARLQGNVGQALGTMQIGDITRQRIEHVRDGCFVLDRLLRRPDATDQEGTRGHILRLLGDQLGDLTEDFTLQSAQLLRTLHALGPDCQSLLKEGKRESGAYDRSRFLHGLATCIASANVVTSQLNAANSKAVKTAEIVVQVVHTLRERVETIEGLRFDVDYMAINVNIQARRHSTIGRPVAVIANEIRLCSLKLAEIIRGVSQIADELGTCSASFESALEGDELACVDQTLECALALIDQISNDSDAAMTALDERSQRIALMISDATEAMAECGMLSEKLQAITDCFGVLADDLPEPHDVDAAHPASTLMADIARMYTMSSERNVHNRHLLAGMTALPTAGTATEAPSSGDDDDLFDDALF